MSPSVMGMQFFPAALRSQLNPFLVKQLGLRTCNLLQCPLFPLLHGVLYNVTPCLIRTKEKRKSSQYPSVCAQVLSPGISPVPFASICHLSLLAFFLYTPPTLYIPSLPCLDFLSLTTFRCNYSILSLLRGLSRFFFLSILELDCYLQDIQKQNRYVFLYGCRESDCFHSGIS